MKAILLDMHLLEGRLEQIQTSKDTLAFMMKKNYELLFEKHGVSDTLFDRSFTYYQQNPKELEAMYEDIVDSLSTLEAQRSSALEEVDVEE